MRDVSAFAEEVKVLQSEIELGLLSLDRPFCASVAARPARQAAPRPGGTRFFSVGRSHPDGALRAWEGIMKATGLNDSFPARPDESWMKRTRPACAWQRTQRARRHAHRRRGGRRHNRAWAHASPRADTAEAEVARGQVLAPTLTTFRDRAERCAHECVERVADQAGRKLDEAYLTLETARAVVSAAHAGLQLRSARIERLGARAHVRGRAGSARCSQPQRRRCGRMRQRSGSQNGARFHSRLSRAGA